LTRNTRHRIDRASASDTVVYFVVDAEGEYLRGVVRGPGSEAYQPPEGMGICVMAPPIPRNTVVTATGEF